MSVDENDPDALQLLDEMDADWVNLWRKAAKGKKPEGKELASVCSSVEEQTQSVLPNDKKSVE